MVICFHLLTITYHMPEEEWVSEIEDLRSLAESATVMCPVCGKKVPSGVSVCPDCGSPIPESTPMKPTETDKEFREMLEMTLKTTEVEEARKDQQTRLETRRSATVGEKSKPIIVEEHPAERQLPRIVGTGKGASSRKGGALHRNHAFSSISRPLFLQRSAQLASIIGVASYVLSFFLVADKLTAAVVMIVGAFLIVISGNVFFEVRTKESHEKVPWREPLTTVKKEVYFVCPVCKERVAPEEAKCPSCGVEFET